MNGAAGLCKGVPGEESREGDAIRLPAAAAAAIGAVEGTVVGLTVIGSGA